MSTWIRGVLKEKSEGLTALNEPGKWRREVGKEGRNGGAFFCEMGRLIRGKCGFCLCPPHFS